MTSRQWSRFFYEWLPYVRKIIKAKLRITAFELDDVISEVFMHLFLNWDRYDNTRNLNNWLSRLIENYCIDYYRANLKYYNELNVPYPAVATWITPFNVYIEKEAELLLSAKLASYKPVERMTLEMKYLYNSNYESISQATGLSNGAIKSIVHRKHNEIENLVNQYLA